MKKILTFVFIASMALGTHAATVTWGLSAITDVDGNAPAAGTMSGYLLLGSTYDDVIQMDISTLVTYLSNGNYLDSADSAYGRVAAVSGTYTSSDAIGTAVSYYIVVLDTPTSSINSASLYTVSDLYSGYVAETNTVSISKNYSTASVAWTATGVPEPTSGLLMLLGLASMALRRKSA